MDAVQNVSESDVLNMVLDAYCVTKVYDRADVDKMMKEDGDIKMDSAPAATIISQIEKQLGRELPEPCDLRPEQFCSVKNLVDLGRAKNEGRAGEANWKRVSLQYL